MVKTKVKFMEEIYALFEYDEDLGVDYWFKIKKIAKQDLKEGDKIFIPDNIEFLKALYDDWGSDMKYYLEVDYLTIEKIYYDRCRVVEDNRRWHWYTQWILPFDFVEKNRDKTLKEIVGVDIDLEKLKKERSALIEAKMKEVGAKKIIFKDGSFLPDEELKIKLIEMVSINANKFYTEEFIEKVRKFDFKKLYQKDGSKLTKKLRKLLLRTSDLSEKQINEILANFVKKYYIKNEKVFFAKWIDKEEVAVGIWENGTTCLAKRRQNEKAGDVFRYSKRFRAIGLFDNRGQKIGRAIVHFNGNREIIITNWYFLGKEEPTSVFVKVFAELMNIKDYTFEYLSERAELPIYPNDGYYIVNAGKRTNNPINKKYVCPFCNQLKRLNVEKGYFKGSSISEYTIAVYCDDCVSVAGNYYFNMEY